MRCSGDGFGDQHNYEGYNPPNLCLEGLEHNILSAPEVSLRRDSRHLSFPRIGPKSYLHCELDRLAIRAAEFGPEADITVSGSGWKIYEHRIQELVKYRGSFKGAIRISLHSLMLSFNYLACPQIPRKSLKFLSLLFSTPTAPTSFLIHLTGLLVGILGDWHFTAIFRGQDFPGLESETSSRAWSRLIISAVAPKL